MGALLVLGAVSAAVFFFIAELFGRAKHIGRWWSFFLLWGCFIVPGVIAILLSPSAKGEPTKPNIFTKYLGAAVFFIIGVLGLMASSISGTADPIVYTIPIAFMILGAYLVWLGEGKVRNDSPKYYFAKSLDGAGRVFGNVFERLRQIFVPSIRNANSIFYFTVEDGVKQGPYTFEEICAKRLSEDQMVWRHRLEKWMKASELPELRGIIVYAPPPIDTEESDDNCEEVTDSESMENETESSDGAIDSGAPKDIEDGASQRISDIKERYRRRANPEHYWTDEDYLSMEEDFSEEDT
jgi:hypothetical protein